MPDGSLARFSGPQASNDVLAGEAVGHLLLDRRETLQRIRERDMPVTTTSQDPACAIRAVLTERELEIF